MDLQDGWIEPYFYDAGAEHMIIVNDWWHKPIMDQEEGLEAIPFNFVGDPQSVLIEVAADTTAAPPTE